MAHAVEHLHLQAKAAGQHRLCLDGSRQAPLSRRGVRTSSCGMACAAFWRAAAGALRRAHPGITGRANRHPPAPHLLQHPRLEILGAGLDDDILQALLQPCLVHLALAAAPDDLVDAAARGDWCAGGIHRTAVVAGAENSSGGTLFPVCLAVATAWTSRFFWFAGPQSEVPRTARQQRGPKAQQKGCSGVPAAGLPRRSLELTDSCSSLGLATRALAQRPAATFALSVCSCARPQHSFRFQFRIG